MFAGLAFLPKAAAAFAVMPRPVLGATLLFSAAFVFINGLQIITSRMLDIRRTLVIGLSFMGGLCVELSPGFFAALPAGIQPFTGSALVFGTMTALLLNLMFRIGVRKTETIAVAPGPIDTGRITDFLEDTGRCGARAAT
jgi:NCS2 family nucleobase:cation symporter-2